MNVLGDKIEPKYSITTHLLHRWKMRIGEGSYKDIKRTIYSIIENGSKYPMDKQHYRVCYNGICIVLKKISPLHVIIKTVYEKDEKNLGAR